MRLGALRIALIYIVLGILWIALSDEVLALFHEQFTGRALLLISSSKGIVFVLLTGALIWKLVRNDIRRSAEREKQYRDLYEGNPLPMWIYDIDSLNIVSVNRTAIENYGYSENEFLSMTILDIRPEEHRDGMRSSIVGVSKNVRHSGTWLHKKANGKLIYVSISSQKVVFNNKQHIMVIAQDIDDHVTFEQRLKKLNVDLREKQNKLSETQQIARVAGWELYLEAKEMIWSDEMYLLTGTAHDATETTLDNYLKLIHPEDRTRVDKALQHCITSGEPLDVTHRIIDGKGSICYVRQMARRESVLDLPFKLIGTIQDITEIKQLEFERNQFQYSLEDTLNTISDGFFTLDEQMVITKVNLQFEEETGKSRADILGIELVEVFPEVVENGAGDKFQKVLKDQTAIKFEVYSPSLNKWMWVSAYPTQEGVAVYFSDVTEEKQKDLRLKEALARYDIVSKATNDVIYDYDIQNDHIIYNTSLSQLVNCDLHKIHHDLHWWRTLIHPDDVTEVAKSQERVLENKETNWWCEYRIDCGDNKYKYVYDQGYFVYNDNNEPIRLIGAIKDIDALKRTDEENKRLAEIITKVNNMVVVMDNDNNITWVNKAFEDYTRYKLDDLMGHKTPDILRRLQVSEQVIDVIAERKSRSESFLIEVPHILPNDGRQWWEVEYTPLFKNNGQRAGYIAVYQNITERKQKEERVIQQNKTLQEIAWLSSHEVRRPVASILGLIYLARDARSVQEKEEIMEMIYHCAEDLDNIVHVISDRVNEDAELAESQAIKSPDPLPDQM